MRSAAFIQVIESKSFILRLEAEMGVPDIKDKLNLYGLCFASRLLLGTSRYESPRQLVDAIRAADPACSRCRCAGSSRGERMRDRPFGICSERLIGLFFLTPRAARLHARPLARPA